LRALARISKFESCSFLIYGFFNKLEGPQSLQNFINASKEKGVTKETHKTPPYNKQQRKRELESSTQGDQDTKKETKKIKQKQRLKSFLGNPAIDQIHERAHLSL
jgi:hypothetical protein